MRRTEKVQDRSTDERFNGAEEGALHNKQVLYISRTENRREIKPWVQPVQLLNRNVVILDNVGSTCLKRGIG